MGACGADCGITRVREEERQAALAVAERAHPGLVWRKVNGAPHAITYDAALSLARHLEELLPMRAVVRTEPSTVLAIDLLAGLHAPALTEIASARRVDANARLAESEVYLRVSFSPWGRFVTIQEVRVSARATPEALEIIEEPVLGVEDARLRAMVKGLQGALRKARLTLLDMAFLARPAEGSQDAYRREFHERPTLWSLLFDSAPPTTVRASLVRRSSSSADAETSRARARSPAPCRTRRGPERPEGRR
jgi:hypothetical protein